MAKMSLVRGGVYIWEEFVSSHERPGKKLQIEQFFIRRASQLTDHNASALATRQGLEIHLLSRLLHWYRHYGVDMIQLLISTLIQ